MFAPKSRHQAGEQQISPRLVVVDWGGEVRCERTRLTLDFRSQLFAWTSQCEAGISAVKLECRGDRCANSFWRGKLFRRHCLSHTHQLSAHAVLDDFMFPLNQFCFDLISILEGGEVIGRPDAGSSWSQMQMICCLIGRDVELAVP